MGDKNFELSDSGAKSGISQAELDATWKMFNDSETRVVLKPQEDFFVEARGGREPKPFDVVERDYGSTEDKLRLPGMKQMYNFLKENGEDIDTDHNGSISFKEIDFARMNPKWTAKEKACLEMLDGGFSMLLQKQKTDTYWRFEISAGDVSELGKVIDENDAYRTKQKADVPQDYNMVSTMVNNFDRYDRDGSESVSTDELKSARSIAQDPRERADLERALERYQWITGLNLRPENWVYPKELTRERLESYLDNEYGLVRMKKGDWTSLGERVDRSRASRSMVRYYSRDLETEINLSR